ncbi:hypothetical protein SEA_ALLEGRO_50 [Mycobacterium phage Allegro]|nr:hypothetical protein SEA_ALLEGRO_50 [Mycobacterium phage Allegro]
MSVATDYPARTDANGATWFRPVRDPGMGIEQWGWTANPLLAHPDYDYDALTNSWLGADGRRYTMHGLYRPKTQPPQEEPPVTVDASDIGIAPPQQRVTQWAEYPLPPALPRPVNKFNQHGHYVLPDPITGLPTGFVRATTAAKTLDDTYNLSRWSTRTQVASVLKLVDYATGPDANEVAVSMLRELREAIDKGNGSTVNDLIERIDAFNGGKNSAEFGDAVHEWCAAVDCAMVTLEQVPEMFRPWVDKYREVLARAGFIAVPQYCERLVLNDAGEERVVGTLDRIYMCVTTGELYLGDLKTSKADNVKWSWMTWPTQLAGYARARLMLGLDGETWEPMPAINQEMAVLIHLPSDAPNMAHMLPMRLSCGDEYLATSLRARHHRKNAKHDVPGLTTPVPSAEALRYVQAYQRIQAAQAVSDLDAVWAEFQDVWSDELTALGHTVAELFTATATPTV